MTDYGLYDDIAYLKEKIFMLEKRTVDMKLTCIQICMQIGWNDEQIKNVVGAFDNELEFFRSCMEKSKSKCIEK